jgi:hypothetical protein
MIFSQPKISETNITHFIVLRSWFLRRFRGTKRGQVPFSPKYHFAHPQYDPLVPLVLCLVLPKAITLRTRAK